MTHLKFRAALLAILFLAMIAFPWVNGNFAVWPDLASAENRALADAPRLAMDSLDSFPKLYDRYYTDHFPMRFRAINLFAHLQYHAFNTSPIPERALIGRDGWLFMEGNEQNAYTGKFRFSPEELESLKQELEYRNDYISKRGGKFYFMIVPTKNVVYADKMPLSVHPSSPKSWGELINDHLRSNSNVRVIDMYPTMRAHSSNEMLYFKLDNHWNERGAFYAAQEMLRVLQADFPMLTPPLATDYAVKSSIAQTGNISRMFGLEVDLQDSMIEMRPRGGFRAQVAPKVPYPSVKGFPYPEGFETDLVTADTTKPSLLLFSDSFGHQIFPTLAEHFSRSVKIFDCWQYKLNPNIVTHEKADIVVLMMLEGNLRNIFEFQSHLKPEE
jgi:alginate O-acetyltransferase complex protein AlgJ